MTKGWWHRTLVLVLLVTCAGFVDRLLTYPKGAFWGDELLLVEAAKSPNGYGSSVLGGLTDVGMGKWRPAFSTLIAIIFKLLPINYLTFGIINLLVTSAIVLVINYLLRMLQVQSLVVAFLVSLGTVFSQFAWYSRWSPYGLMELSATLFTLVGSLYFIFGLQERKISKHFLAASSLMIATLFHERYLILLAIAVVFAAASLKGRRRLGAVMTYLTFVCTYLIIKGQLLGLDPLTGGGEEQLRGNLGSWILRHFEYTVRSVLGWSDGQIISFNRATGDPVGTPSSLRLLLFFVFISGVFVTLLMALLPNGRQSLHDSTPTALPPRSAGFRPQIFLLSALIGLCIPASTVASRIEGRWLYTSHLFLLILIATLCSLRGKAMKRPTIVLLALALTNVGAARSSLSVYEYPMRISQKVVATSETLGPKIGAWNLRIVERKNLDQWPWRLGYGAVFRKLPNPPTTLSFGMQDCSSPCMTIHIESSSRIWTTSEEVNKATP
jgi:hypothetical protein